MIYIREHPNTPSKRFRSRILNPIGSKITLKAFSKSIQTHSPLHFGTKTCKRRKHSIYKSKFNLLYGSYSSKPCVIINIGLERRYKTFVGVVSYSNGMLQCLPLFSGAVQGSILKTWEYINTPKLFFLSSLKTGYTIPVAYLSVTMCFFNIQSKYVKNTFFCKAAGTFCILMRYSIERSFCVIKLPSVRLKIIPESTYVMLGRNSNLLPSGIWDGKAGYNINRGFRPIVRGVAKNPVDHPHGGRTKTNSPERTPWGRVAKHNK